MFGIVLLYPFHRLVLTQQLYGYKRERAIRTVFCQQRLKSVYRGVLPPVFGKAASYAMMFGLQDVYLKQLHKIMPAKQYHYAPDALAGSLAGNLKSIQSRIEHLQKK